MVSRDRISLLRMIYGPNVVCTNGLFHLIDDLHQEIYINNETNEIDKRTKYKTIEVTNRAILAFDLSQSQMSLLGNKLIETNSDVNDYTNILNGTILLLDKNNLEYKYKTNNQLKHIKNDIFIVYDNEKCNSELIDNNGKLKLKLDNCNSIVDIENGIYIFQSILMFNDKLVYINNKGKVTDLTENKRYRIKKLDNNKVRITLMTGGEYIVDLKIKQCLNVFTQKIEAYTNLFSVVI